MFASCAEQCTPRRVVASWLHLRDQFKRADFESTRSLSEASREKRELSDAPDLRQRARQLSTRQQSLIAVEARRS